MSHLQNITRELASMEDLSPLLTMIDSGCTVIQHLAIRRLEALCDQHPRMLEAFHEDILNAPSPRRLNAICSLNSRQRSEPILSHFLPRLRHCASGLQKSIARLVCRQFPEQTCELIHNATKPVARVLCFHAIRGDIRFPDMCLLQEKLQAVESTGLSELITNILELENASSTDSRWVSINTISQYVLSLQLGYRADLLRLSDGRAITELSADKSADSELIVSGLLMAEREALRVRELPPAWRFSDLRDELDGLCQFIHLPSILRNQQCLEVPRIEADSIGVPGNLLTQFLLEYAASKLISEDLRSEAEVFRIARWQVMSLTETWSPKRFEVRISPGGQPRLPEALRVIQHNVIPTKQGCLDATAIRQFDDRFAFVSPCAKAAIRISKTANPEQTSVVASQLLDAETFWSKRLTPIGIEIQIPQVNKGEVAGWLEFFRSHGIPTPRRRECGFLFELAVPPAASWHAPTEILKSVLAFKVPLTEQDLCIHVSLQGELREVAGALAFTQLFLNSSITKTPRAPSALRHVLSKGLVYRNSDVVPCHWSDPATCRTELRVMSLPVSKSLSALQEVTRVGNSLRELQLLGSAALSPHPKIRRILSDFQNNLECLIREFPLCLQELLNADFYESTGDFQATSLIDRLEILKRRDTVRQTLHPQARLRLIEQLALLRSRCASQLEQHWKDDAQYGRSKTC